MDTRIRNIMRALHKVLMIPLGALAGAAFSYMILTWTHYEAPTYLTIGFIIQVPLITAQLLCMMLIFYVFARWTKLNFVFSASKNFLISMSFAMLYNVCFISIVDAFKPSFDSPMFCFLLLPLTVFVLIVASIFCFRVIAQRFVGC